MSFRPTDIEPRRSSADGSGRGQGGRSPPAEKSRTLRPRTPQPYPKITKTLFLAKDPHAIRGCRITGGLGLSRGLAVPGVLARWMGPGLGKYCHGPDFRGRGAGSAVLAAA